MHLSKFQTASETQQLGWQTEHVYLNKATFTNKILRFIQ